MVGTVKSDHLPQRLQGPCRSRVRRRGNAPRLDAALQTQRKLPAEKEILRFDGSPGSCHSSPRVPQRDQFVSDPIVAEHKPADQDRGPPRGLSQLDLDESADHLEASNSTGFCALVFTCN